MKTLKEQVIESLIKAGEQGLTADQIKALTDQGSHKLARQLMRKARWSLYEMGYRLAKDNERVDGVYVVYRAIKLKEGVRVNQLERKFEVELYPIKQAA